MKDIRERARENFPSVLLTLLSIVQAIALESLWDYAIHQPDLFEATWAAFLGWMQVVVTLNFIVMIWLIYVGLVMRFRWTPTMADSALPFAVGLIEFTMIEVMGPEDLWAYVFVLCFISIMMHHMIHVIMQRARHDPDNRVFFEQVESSTWRDRLPPYIRAFFVAWIGIWLWRYGYNPWLALFIYTLSLVAMMQNLLLQARYWRMSMGEDL